MNRLSTKQESHILLLFYTLPAFVLMGLMVIYPFIFNVILSFSNMSLVHFRDWKLIGLQNYLQVISDPHFRYTLFKTILWTVINVFFHVVIGISLALFLHQNLKGKALFRTLLILPWAVPQYITALTWRGMFNAEYGWINLALSKWFGISLPWLSTEWGAFTACLIANIWLGFPFMMVIALGGLQSISEELYEAAEIDGASFWQKLWHITLPLLKPVMAPAITLGIIWTFNKFNVVWLVSNGGEPSDKTHILVSWVYKSAFTYFRIGYASAFSMLIFAMLLIFAWQFIQKTKATESVYG